MGSILSSLNSGTEQTGQNAGMGLINAGPAQPIRVWGQQTPAYNPQMPSTNQGANIPTGGSGSGSGLLGDTSGGMNASALPASSQSSLGLSLGSTDVGAGAGAADAAGGSDALSSLLAF